LRKHVIWIAQACESDSAGIVGLTTHICLHQLHTHACIDFAKALLNQLHEYACIYCTHMQASQLYRACQSGCTNHASHIAAFVPQRVYRHDLQIESLTCGGTPVPRVLHEICESCGHGMCVRLPTGSSIDSIFWHTHKQIHTHTSTCTYTSIWVCVSLILLLIAFSGIHTHTHTSSCVCR
jgi:hypothetical protein